MSDGYINALTIASIIVVMAILVRQLLLLSHSLGSDLRMYAGLIPHLTDHFHIIRYDHPGHGQSDPRINVGTIEDYRDDARYCGT